MRIARVLCTLFVVLSCISVGAAAQYDRSSPAPGNPAFPPAAPGPLYLPYLPKDGVPALTAEQLELLSREPRMPQALREHLQEEAGDLRLAQQPTRPADDGFKPISELPPEERLPAAPMLVAAYVFVALALFAYVLSVARRLNAVGREIGRIDAQLKQR